MNSAGVFAFIALLIVTQWSYAVVPLLLAATLLAGLVFALRDADWQGLDREDGLFCLTLVAYGGLWLLDVWRSGHWPVGEGNQGILLPLWPLLAAVMLVWLRLFPPDPVVLWQGVGCGALGAGSIALYERVVLGHERASNGMNAIPFGNLALLLGALSLLAALWSSGTGKGRHPWWLLFALSAAMAGLLGSLLSGTRGGWIAMPFLMLLGHRAAAGLMPSNVRHCILGGVVVMLMVVLLIPQTGVSGRIGLAVDNVQQYWQDESRGTSVGLRLEMWRAGYALFLERPLTGWGEGHLEAARDALVEQGARHPGIRQHDQLHSDLIDTAARRGLVGLSVLLLLYLVPLWLSGGDSPRQALTPI
ncbi:O-antigen ligase family protein [Halomonas daqiaonensis]|uniref:O-antigen ligase family protein n=1 Tax=Halomonas daqiaonensis TaxID=650850 RepID=UPI001FCD0987|nr:O-antigen ligase family protein [Halomonas daqiaonensis]